MYTRELYLMECIPRLIQSRWINLWKELHLNLLYQMECHTEENTASDTATQTTIWHTTWLHFRAPEAYHKGFLQVTKRWKFKKKSINNKQNEIHIIGDDNF